MVRRIAGHDQIKCSFCLYTYVARGDDVAHSKEATQKCFRCQIAEKKIFFVLLFVFKVNNGTLQELSSRDKNVRAVAFRFRGERVKIYSLFGFGESIKSHVKMPKKKEKLYRG